MMKELLIKALFNSETSNSKHIQKVALLGYVLKQLRVSRETVALVTKNKELQSYFQIACLLRGVNYVILDKYDVDTYLMSQLEVKILFLDMKLYPIVPENLYESTFINVILNTSTLYIESVNSAIPNALGHKLNINAELSRYFREYSTLNKSLNDLRIEFENHCVNHNNNSLIFVVHPGNSSYGEKISVFKEEALAKGLLQIIDTIGKELSTNTTCHNAYTVENTTYPYVFLLNVLYPLFKGGDFYVSNRVDLKNFPIGYATISSYRFTNTLLDMIDDNRVLSLFYRKGFNLFAKYLLRRIFKKQFKSTPVFVVYGQIDKRLRKLLNHLNVRVFYMYTMIEVSSFITYKYYRRIPISKKELTVGRLPMNAVASSKSIEGNAELLIDLPTQFDAYTNIDFTTLCTMSNKFPGMHGTLDIVSEKDNGEIVVLGKAEELFENQNGLTIQSNLIYSLVLDNQYVDNAIISVIGKNIFVLVELRLSRLLLQNITAEEVIVTLNTVLLPKINQKVSPYSKVERISMVPGNFERDLNGKIKTSRYLIDPQAE